MASYCPHCGTQAPDEARYCMRCGREREPVATERGAVEPTGAPLEPSTGPTVPPVSPPLGPPPPSYAPAPASPSASAPASAQGRPPLLGAFLGRTFRGDWAGAARAAAWPVGLVLVAALALAIPSYGQNDTVVVGFGERLRIALAALLQALGGGLEVKDAAGSVLGDASGGLLSGIRGGGSLSLVPLTVTALWIAALCIGVRGLRRGLVERGSRGATAGAEAAVRVALLLAAATLVLGLCARPTLAEGVEISTSPWLAALGALLLGSAVAGGVLLRAETGRLPGTRLLLRATGTALRAYAAVLVLCSVVAFVVCVTQFDDNSGGSRTSAVVFALLLLPNLAVLALGLSWGASIDAEANGSSPYGGAYRHQGFGLSELGHQVNAWAVVGALALGLVCALTVGAIAARRSADRREQLLASGVFIALFLLLAWIGGFGWQLSATASGYGSGFGYGSDSGYSSPGAIGGTVEAGVSLPEGLLFGLLWVFGAAFVAPYLVRMTGGRTTVVAPPLPPMPSTPAGYGPGMPPVPEGRPRPGTPPTPGPAPDVPPVPSTRVEPLAPPAPVGPPSAYHAPPAPTANHHVPAYVPGAPAPGAPAPSPVRRSSVLVWVVTIVVACVVGGGAAAALLFWQGHH
ncbi:hypothetical protein AAW14_27010 [Streptomyces hygroscopicus]|uniref:zinc ribbon domain-containing protein n=1 Tax=Streptomyces hygroscopicus TaxID=1912 RepID=UPI00223F8891|nr:zinc ribbon domain-containing protein [Streptomyces hygroscopicus]MCW7945560.1 hypothetical protein [Streptomyces hygroscopicus]